MIGANVIITTQQQNLAIEPPAPPEVPVNALALGDEVLYLGDYPDNILTLGEPDYGD